MTLEEEVRELRRRVAELEARPMRVLPKIDTPWMDSWKPSAPPVYYVVRTGKGDTR